MFIFYFHAPSITQFKCNVNKKHTLKNDSVVINPIANFMLAHVNHP